LKAMIVLLLSNVVSVLVRGRGTIKNTKLH